MLEFPVIQQRGFRNIVENGKVTGFQVPIRSTYYRGLWLSQLRPASLVIDGEEFSGSSITWQINGQRYSQDSLAKLGDVHWSNQDVAILEVSKPGGLALGIHEVELKCKYSASYLPPRIDLQELGDQPRRMVLVR